MGTQILEINLISAQGLKAPSANLRRMQTYAITWINPAAKLRTRVDSLGGENPTWNDKFLFRVSDEFISGDTSAVSVEIFAVGYIKDFLIGSVRFLLSTCIKRSASAIERSIGTPAFTAVQIRRSSGRFQGALNIAAAVYHSSDYPILEKISAVSFHDLMERKGERVAAATAAEPRRIVAEPPVLRRRVLRSIRRRRLHDIVVLVGGFNRVEGVELCQRNGGKDERAQIQRWGIALWADDNEEDPFLSVRSES